MPTLIMLAFQDMLVRGYGVAGILPESLILLAFAAVFFCHRCVALQFRLTRRALNAVGLPGSFRIFGKSSAVLCLGRDDFSELASPRFYANPPTFLQNYPNCVL